MRAIHKFELVLGDKTTHPMDPNGLILACGNQDRRFVLWAEVNPNAPKVDRSFAVYGTGWTLDDQHGRYLGTAQFNDGQFVFHAYEITP